MKQKAKDTIKIAGVALGILLFSTPLGYCFLIVGDLIIKSGNFIKNLL